MKSPPFRYLWKPEQHNVQKSDIFIHLFYTYLMSKHCVQGKYHYARPSFGSKSVGGRILTCVCIYKEGYRKHEFHIQNSRVKMEF